MQDPVKKYPKENYSKKTQPEPGLVSDLDQKPDHGENSYKGTGRLRGRRALVTGADSGIGRATAIAFAREGADIMMNFLPSEKDDAEEVVKLIKEAGCNVYTCPGDIADEKFCKKLIKDTIACLGGVDVLANIAGKQVSVQKISELSTEQFDKTFKVNVYSMFWLCKYALPHMAGGSTIINTASIQSYDPSAHLLDYASTKAAITGFTKALSKQVIEDGIRVNAVAPGPIWTPLQPSQGQPKEALENFGKDTPYGRPGQPAEVAPVFVFLASQESSYITGESIGVTGGKHLP